MGKITLEGYKCERCEHVWIPRSTTEGDPIICPKCKSPYWNKPRRMGGKKQEAVVKEKSKTLR